MTPCVQNQEQMLDLLYGLLEADEAEGLQRHLKECPSCQSAYAQAQDHQGRFARAARIIESVPEFKALEQSTELAAPLPTQTLRSSSDAAPRRARRGFRTTIIAACMGAAACLLVVVLYGRNHHQDVSTQQARVDQLQHQAANIELKLAALDQRFTEEKQRLGRSLKDDAVQMHVSGPIQVVPGVSAGYRIALKDLEGNFRHGTVEVEFLDAQNKPLAEKEKLFLRETGELAIPMELAKQRGAVRMKAVARQGAANEVGVVEERIEVKGPEHALHLATNKSLYRPGEKVRFRTLVLDRFLLKPPAQPVALHVSLLNEQGVVAVPPIDVTAVGGIAAGEVHLPASLVEGTYSLQIFSDTAVAIRRALQVLPASAPPVEMLTNNALRYRANEPIPQSLQLFNRDGTPAANAPVLGNVNVYEQRNGVHAKAEVNLTGKADAQGVYNFVIPPRKDAVNLRQQVTIDLKWGPPEKREKAAIRQEVEVLPAKLSVDFYPEGGRLIAGTRNRVFYRVRTPQGDTVTPDGRVIVLSSRDVIYDSEREQSMGAFTFVPDPKETYTLRLTGTKQEIATPFKTLGIHAQGVLIRGDTVQADDQPLKLDIENRGGERQVQVVATCRGQIVYHDRMRLAASTAAAVTPTAVPMVLPKGLAGIVRVTLFEVDGAALKPLTERVFFRTPSKVLRLHVNLGDTRIPPGKGKIDLGISATNESKKAAAFWALASVVDDRYRDQSETPLHAQFLLLGEASDDVDLADLPLIAPEGAVNNDALELALGVFGWRRLESSDAGAAAPVLTKAADKLAVGLTFFHRVEPSTIVLRDRFKQKWTISQNALADAAQKQRTELIQERTTLREALGFAQADLSDLTRRPRETMLRVLGVTALALFVVAALGMCYGLICLLRRAPAAGAFGTAIGCMTACLFLLVFRPDADPVNNDQGVAVAPGKARPDAELRIEPPPAFARGVFAFDNVLDKVRANSRADRIGSKELANFGASDPNKGALAKKDGTRDETKMIPLTDALARGQSRANVSRELQEHETKKNERLAARRASLDSPAMPGAGFGGAAKAGVSPALEGMGLPGPAPGGPVAPPSLPMASDPLVKPKVPSSPIAQPAALPAAPATTAAPPVDSDLQDKAVNKLVNDSLQESTKIQVDLDRVSRTLALRRSSDLADPATLLWSPALRIPASGLVIPVEIPPGPAGYRVLILGHTMDGRLGYFESRLQVREQTP